MLSSWRTGTTVPRDGSFEEITRKDQPPMTNDWTG
jgi:hypothetical protein